MNFIPGIPLKPDALNNMGIKKYNNIYTAGYIMLILLWATTAASKLGNLNGFHSDLDRQVFSKIFTGMLLYAVPITELVTAALLTFDKTRLAGLVISLFLISAFTAYIILILSGFFNKVPCSCGGVLKFLGWKAHLYFNSFFLLLSASVIYIHLKREVGDI
ncbi:MauE/DoxX family redox-associated membrane protein [Pedobacter sp. Bi27]|uniref:MauE/DoxX family redox-associated membrane protein n=1 Tax=Pedobacter sp. Bi27 TaxID=2822351 RepID=UPI001E3D356A|nr:MauE/DoxX family redox-associated membrane protein [Pedobacter sp. Bi27]